MLQYKMVYDHKAEHDFFKKFFYVYNYHFL